MRRFKIDWVNVAVWLILAAAMAFNGFLWIRFFFR